MDLENLIDNAVQIAVEKSVKNITINQIVVNDRWLLPKEAMEILGIKSKNTLSKNIKLGIIPKPNSLGRFKLSKLMEIR